MAAWGDRGEASRGKMLPQGVRHGLGGFGWWAGGLVEPSAGASGPGCPLGPGTMPVLPQLTSPVPCPQRSQPPGPGCLRTRKSPLTQPRWGCCLGFPQVPRCRGFLLQHEPSEATESTGTARGNHSGAELGLFAPIMPQHLAGLLAPSSFLGIGFWDRGLPAPRPPQRGRFPPTVPVHVVAPREPREFPAGTVQEAPESERETAGLGQRRGSPGIPPLPLLEGLGETNPTHRAGPCLARLGAPKSTGDGALKFGFGGWVGLCLQLFPRALPASRTNCWENRYSRGKKSFMLQQTVNMGVIRDIQGQKTSTAAGDLNKHPGTSLCAPHPGVPGPRDLCCRAPQLGEDVPERGFVLIKS